MKKKKGCKGCKKMAEGLVYAYKKRILEAEKEGRWRSLRKMFACVWKKMRGVP